MDIYIIRHTTPDIAKGICYGQTNLELTDDFQTESDAILSKLPKNKTPIVYSSPLKRCTQLAARIASSYSTDKRLLELNFGTWELKNWNDIPKNEMTPWMENFVHEKVPMGESYTELATRVAHFFEEISNTNHEQIIIVTHGGVQRALLAQLTNTPLKKSFDIKIAYGQISKVSISETTHVIMNF